MPAGWLILATRENYGCANLVQEKPPRAVIARTVSPGFPTCSDHQCFHLAVDLAARRPVPSLDPGEHRKLPDALVLVGVEEGVIILERDAAVGIPVGPEHVGVCEQAGAAVDRLLTTDRSEAQRRHAVEQ